MGSKYCYPSSNVLINKFNIQEQEKLNQIEKYFTQKRLMELDARPVYGRFDLKHMQQIHKYIFQDIYPFAGKIRDVDIAKGRMFCRAVFIQENAKDIFQSLKSEKYLKGLNIDHFSERAGKYMADINILHPFREGNGRTQREFMRTLSLNAGYRLDWSRIDGEKLYDAFVKDDPKQLGTLIRDAIVNQEPDRNLMKMFRDLDPALER